jgi:hypothetical protein
MKAVNREAETASLLISGFGVAFFGWALVHLASSPSHPNKDDRRATESRFRRWLDATRHPLLKAENDSAVAAGADSSVAQPLKTMKTRARVIDFLSCISYWNFLPRLGKLLNTRLNFELGDGDARFWSAHGTSTNPFEEGRSTEKLHIAN